MNSISNRYKTDKKKAGKTVRDVLGSTGARVTPQRTLIMEIIRQGKGHLDADDIYRRARKMKPRLSLSTVYRTLRALKRLDLVDEIHLDDSHHHYETKPSAEHHHLICLGCGRVIEFQYRLSHHIKQEVAEARDFDIAAAEIRLTGYCPQCRQGRQPSRKTAEKET